MRNGIAAIGSTVVSGFSNVLIQLLAARLLSTDEYALFAIGSATILFLLGLARAVIGDTDLIRGDRMRDRGVVAAAYVIALSGIAAGVLTIVAAVLVSHPAVMVVGIALLLSPMFVLQDTARFRAFRVAKAWWALLSDSVVLVIGAAALIAPVHIGGGAAGLLAVWGISSGVGFCVVIRPLQYLAKVSDVVGWWRGNRDLVTPGGIEYVLTTTAPYMLNWVILGLGGAGALAGYRIVQLVFGSLGNLAQGIGAFELPRISVAPTRRSLRLFLVRNGLMLMVPAVMLFVIISHLPSRYGTLLFGESWYGVSAFILAGALHGFVNALMVSGFQVLRIQGEARYSLVVRIGTVILIPILSFGLGSAFGAVGIAWSLALVAVIGYLARLTRILTSSWGASTTGRVGEGVPG